MRAIHDNLTEPARRHGEGFGALILAAIFAFAGVAAAGADEADAPDAPERSADEDAEREDDSQRAAPPSLDDLLGIDEDEQDRGADEAAQRDRDEELRRRLAEQDLSNTFAEAIEKMSLSAQLLDVDFDAGLGTQRVQEEVLAMLDHLINQVSNQPPQGGGGGGSGQPQAQPDPGQQPQEPGAGDCDGEGDVETMPPGFQQDDEIGAELEEHRAEWGALPDRIRDMLLQGREETYSSLYEQLTREYYRRLAEER